MRLLYILLIFGFVQAAVWHETYRFAPGRFEQSAAGAYTVVTAADMDVTDEPGMPQLPVLPQSIELPGRCRVTSVRVTPRGWVELQSGVVVLPAQRQVPLSTVISGQSVVAKPNSRVYHSDQSYPSDSWRWTGTGQRQGNTRVDLVLYPVRYTGAEKKLEYCREFDVEVEYELPVGAEKPGHSLRPAESRPQSGKVPGFLWDPSSFEYVIVTNGRYDSVFRRLADWKTEKGVPAVIRHIDWVLSTYTGRDNAEKLRNYLKTLPDSGVKYVLLGGDVSVIPFRKAYAMTSEGRLHPREDSLPCDLYFSDLDGDWDRNGNNVFGEVADSVDLYPDVSVGRAPVDNVAEAQAFVNKVLEYERTPAQPKQTNALFFAEVMWQNPYTDGGVHKDKLEAAFFSTGYTVTKKYQRLGNESRASVMAAIRDGQNYLNHDGHGWIDVLSCGPPPYLRTRDADTITNDYRGIIFSIGCWTTAFDTVSIGEAFVTNPNGGTVATVGNSSYGWGSPGNPGFGYSEKFDDRFWRMVQHLDGHRVGDALAESKAYFVPFSRGANVYRWHQYQLNLMGCPEMPVWTRGPESLEVSGPDRIPSGTSRVLVTVSRRGLAVRSARVCLMKPGESYSVAVTNAAGEAWLEVGPHTAGDFTLTVTADNYLPAQLTVPGSAGPYLNFIGWNINDSLGNRDGIVNENELIELGIRLHNAGSAASAGLPLVLRTHEPVVNMLDSLTSSPVLNPGDSCFIPGAFRIQTRACPDDGKLLQFELTVRDTVGPRTFRPVLQLGLPRLALKRHFYSSPPALPGQTKGIRAVIDNLGGGFGHSTWARLVSLDPNITVQAPESILLGELAPRSRNTTADGFTVSISGSCPGSYLAAMRLDLWCETYQFSHPLRLLVGNYGFSDDMETGPAKWTHSGRGDRWHLSRHRSQSGGTSWYAGDSVTRLYVPGMDAALTTVPFMVAENCSLRFWRWFAVPNYGVDGIYVVILRKDRADTLDFIGTGGALPEKSEVRYQMSDVRCAEAGNGGRSADGVFEIVSDWFEEQYDLSFLAVGETIQVKLGFKSDLDADVGEGFYIDDVVVTGGNPPPAFVAEPTWPTSRSSRLMAWPNPFRSSVVLRMAHGLERGASLRIFDASGRAVRSLALSRESSAVGSVVWDGRDDAGRKVPAGPYFVELRRGLDVRITRVVLVR